ncbi:MAG: T9SS type A sorting domain-containing protein [Bacteroidales bacterium]|nr:T9SS type A sorting domain-containing protein [Bacteroidales bacterium]MCF8404653.1 T9SS type A sorting domain-containing protein [Bacteroidales bacterium]
MKQALLFTIGLFYAFSTLAQTTATDFTVNDCNGQLHNLFSELDEGKVIVIAWVMPCGACIGPSLQAYTAAKSFSGTHPGQVLYYLVDDYANTSCPTIAAWGNANSMGEADAYFSNAEISMNDYGTPGMPKIVVVGCSEHKVYYNKNYTANGIEDAINTALLECNTINTGMNDQHENDLHINLYPNPAHNILSFSFELAQASSLTAEVLDFTGQTVLDVAAPYQPNGHVELSADIRSLSNGVYFLRIRSNSTTQMVKFSVVR